MLFVAVAQREQLVVVRLVSHRFSSLGLTPRYAAMGATGFIGAQAISRPSSKFF